MLTMLDQTEGKPCDPHRQTLNDGAIYQLYKQSEKLAKEDGCWLGYLTQSFLACKLHQ